MLVTSRALSMANKVAKWRPSASLIILSKNGTKLNESSDYKVLLFSRSAKASFMPTTSVFPGGVCEKFDASSLWLKHFKSMGIPQEDLQKLILRRNQDLQPQPEIFLKEEGDCLHRDISLRITAIRETFEEMGIMLCRDRNNLKEGNCGFGFYREDFDRKHWQHLVHNDASQFLSLCQKLEVVPDLWSLNEWSVWLTPAVFPKRFQTAFYLVALPDTPHVILEENEGTNYEWMTPKEALIANTSGDIFLAPPQSMELSRLLNFNELSEVQKFAHHRALKGSILLLPVEHLCIDGMVSILPGDSNYPIDPYATSDYKSIDLTIEQFRGKALKLNRQEFINPHCTVIHNNIESMDGHVKPITMRINAQL